MLALSKKIQVRKADRDNLELDPADGLYDLLRNEEIPAGWTEPSCRPSYTNYFGVAAQDGIRAMDCLERHGYVCEVDDEARDLMSQRADANADPTPILVSHRLLDHPAIRAAARPPFTDAAQPSGDHH